MEIRRLASRLWRGAVRRPLGRLLHATRRRSALRRLRGRRETIRSILFVCHGNICRSPYAEAAFRKLLQGAPLHAIHVSSAGFLGPGRSAPPTAVAVAARHGVDLTPHRSQLVDAARVEAAHLIVVMDPRQGKRIRVAFRKWADEVLILADLLPAFGEARMIRDPVEKPEEVFEEVYTRIDECLGAMRRALAGDSSAYRPPQSLGARPPAQGAP